LAQGGRDQKRKAGLTDESMRFIDEGGGEKAARSDEKPAS